MEISSTLRKNKARAPKAIRGAIKVRPRHGAVLSFPGDPRGEKWERDKPEEDGEDIEGEDSPVVVCDRENQPGDDDVHGYDYCCKRLGIMLVRVTPKSEQSTHSEEYQRVPVKGVVSNAIRSKSEDNDCGDELGSSQTYEWL
jgi:hypothetical protein